MKKRRLLMKEAPFLFQAVYATHLLNDFPHLLILIIFESHIYDLRSVIPIRLFTPNFYKS